jgi:phosphoglycolate phosphatase-like HAD superfamily hydrolase
VDCYDAYLFDIDGTLLHCKDAVHYFAFCEALTKIAKRPLDLDGVTTQGNTDIGILRDALNLAGIPEDEWRPCIADICDCMGDFVESGESDLTIQVLPGVIPLLDLLRAREKTLAVATGNLERIGRAKLAHCGLLPYFHFGQFSDYCEYRHQVFREAKASVEKLLGASAKICVIGDTTTDITAAHANQLDIIAVATGIFNLETLSGHRPTACVNDLTELLDQLPQTATISSN